MHDLAPTHGVLCTTQLELLTPSPEHEEQLQERTTNCTGA